jgi:4-carboxymuconolactone decarboxylase
MLLNGDYYEQGIELMGKVMGDDWIAASRKKHEEAVAAGDTDRSDFSTEVLFGFMFGRPQLSLRDRALVMIASDIAQNTPNALRSHVQVGLYAGITRDEIREILFMMTQYCGHPRAREADIAITKLFPELDAKK